ncbi:MAG: toll/interleukin-1 receptor domain-containing protein [Hyphomicrobiales bacterium]|nr:MAG: toll/interleukin-1 receptor domain-containing protein [Hyphomicrobiales bacterium]
MTQIFISYSRRDLELARTLAGHLEAQGYDVWWDAEMEGGRRFEDQIHQALHEAPVAIVLWSRHSVASDWVRAEAEIARKRHSTLPVLIDDVAIDALPMLYHSIHMLDLKRWNGDAGAAGFRQLLAAVNDRIEHAKSGATTPFTVPKHERHGAPPNAPVRRPLLLWGGLAGVAAVVIAVAVFAAAPFFSRTVEPSVPIPDTVISEQPSSEPPLPSEEPVPPQDEYLQADYFEPNVAYNDTHWGFYISSRIGARYIGYETYYSLDGKFFERSHRSEAVILLEDPPTNAIWLEFRFSDGTKAGPFRYEFDLEGIKTKAILDDVGSGDLSNSLVAGPVDGGTGKFRMIAALDRGTMRLRAVTSRTIKTYRIDFGDGFMAPYEADDRQMITFPLDQSWPADDTLAIELVDRFDQSVGKSDFVIDRTRLEIGEWEQYWDEARALSCYASNWWPNNDFNSPGPKIEGVECQVQNNWRGIVRAVYGTSPSAMNRSFEGGRDCPDAYYGLCGLDLQFPGQHDYVYAQFTYADGHTGEVRRFATR